VVLIIAGSASWYQVTHTKSASNGTGDTVTYTSDFGVKFDYPIDYLLNDKTVRVSLITDTPEHRQLLAGNLPGREGPVSIDVSFFENVDHKGDLKAWIENGKNSLYTLGPKVLVTAVIDGEPGYRYRWSGLYEGETVAVQQGDIVYLFSVSWMNATDPIIADFDQLLTTVRFSL